MVLRVIRAYKTVSEVAASLLARIPLLFLTAAKYKRIYERIRGLRNLDLLTTDAAKEIYDSADLLMSRQWQALLQNSRLPDARVRDVILPIFNQWLRRKHGSLTYYLTQILTGHESFGDFLFKIRKVPSSLCPHCDDNMDSMEHTMLVCTAWSSQRHLLQDKVGLDISWPVLLPKMLNNKECWSAVVTFATEVISTKERLEWQQQGSRRPRGPLRRSISGSSSS